ncbi:lymphocyte antigen 6G-like isoform X1 [Kryptolebias marmoratus]|uniref:lymphocyte antigen 6G-like isoform X1 n=1 Tax=Kryptolebias marmoratus TaxID=37003 RepID=UPI0007F92C9F|nr:lymphocyte antigen 6G-like isoform X1 [Kryptolebias marmoratus]
MKIYGALILLMTLSAACGLTCYICNGVQPKSCVNVMSCPKDADRCFSLKDNDSSLVSKGCKHHSLCISPVSCCEGDLCNSGVPTGPSAFLLLLSSALFTIFI